MCAGAKTWQGFPSITGGFGFCGTHSTQNTGMFLTLVEQQSCGDAEEEKERGDEMGKTERKSNRGGKRKEEVRADIKNTG